MSAAFSVTEVVTAARCPRQLVLARDGRRVVPYGGSAIGQAAHAALAALVKAAPSDAGIARALGPAKPEAEDVAAACYRAAFGESHRRAHQIAGDVDGSDLARLDGIVRNSARLLSTLLSRARRATKNAADAISRSLLASETEVALEFEGVVVRGRIDLLCRDLETRETWLWDLKTYAGTDAAQMEQVRVYALAYRAQDVKARPALLHVTEDRVEIARARRVDEIDLARLGARLREMTAWLGGTPPPPAAPDRNTCRTCPAQEACWARWGRTLAEDDEPGADEPDDPPRGGTAPGLGPDRATLPFIGFAPALFSRPGVARAPLDPAPLWLGRLEQGRTDARLEPADLLRHVAVFGAPGAGKTYFAKSIVEEAVLAGIPALVFDVQGDLAQLAAADPSAPLASRRDAYVERAEVRLFTPASDAGLRVSLNPLRLPAASLGEDERTFCLAAMADNLLSPLKIPSSWRNVAKSYVAQHLEAAIEASVPLDLEQLVERVRDPAALGAAPLASKSQREKLYEQLRLLTVGPQRLLFQRGRALDIDELVRPRAGGKVPVNVVWLNALGDQDAKERFVGMVLAEVYAWMLAHPAPEPQLLLYLDEVGPYMPPSREPASKAILKRLFKEGRKYGVCGLFCTQDFTDVDYKVFSQANTVVLGRVNSPQNKDKARKILQSVPDFDAAGACDRLGGAPSGRFLVKCPDRFPAPRWLQGRKLLTRHGSPWTEDEIRAHVSDDVRAWWSRP
jgi:hypothetical protein